MNRHLARLSQISGLACLIFLMPVSLFAQFDPGGGEVVINKACYSVEIDPSGVLNTQIGGWHRYRLALKVGSIGCYSNVFGRLTYLDKSQGISVGPYNDFHYNTQVSIGQSAYKDSYFNFKIDVVDRANPSPYPGGVIRTLPGTVRINVADGQVLLADLLVSNISAPGSVEAGDSFTVRATVRNNGQAQASGTFYNRLRFNGVTQNPDLTCSNLNAGSSCIPKWTITPTSTGTKTIQVCTDSRLDIDESNEGNNCATESIMVTEPSLPDFIVESMSVNPAIPTEGHAATVTIRTKNVGNASGSSFDVRFDAPGHSETKTCSGLSTNGICEKDFIWIPSSDGSMRLTSEVDPTDRVDELSESNNSGSTAVAVNGLNPDLYFHVSGVTVFPTDPSVGDTLLFTFRMYNSGEEVSAPKMKIEGSGGIDEEFTCHEGIENADYCERTLQVDATTAGPQWITATADPDNDISESSEGNNSRTLNYVVEDATQNIICQGTWHLAGINGTTFDTSSQGSVIAPCSVYFAQNTPSGCWKTNGADGLQTEWFLDGGASCPTRAKVTNPNTGEEWQFSVSIQ